ncbi:MAG: hypothetical protein ACXWHI_12395 [Candidatus Aminicenantales bacterium]
MTARRMVKGTLAAAATALWVMLIVTIDPHAEVICAAMPHLAVTLGLAFAGVAFLIGIAPGRSDL